jgi:tetratricopeptide (TPR) repeat protein
MEGESPNTPKGARPRAMRVFFTKWLYDRGFMMSKTVCIRYLALFIVLTVLPIPSVAWSGEVHVYLNNEDHLSGGEVMMDDQVLALNTSHCGRVVVERSAVKGISRKEEHAEDILSYIGEHDIVHNLNGDRISGRITGIKDRVVSIEAFFAEGKLVTVELGQLDYLTLASQKKAEPTEKADEVHVIFVNGDVMSGKMEGFEAGQFVLNPPYTEKIRFDATAFRSLHNAKESKEFFAGGIAEAMMSVIERSGESQGAYSQVYPSLVKTFLKDGDKKGALVIFRRIAAHHSNQYTFQQIGDEFLAAGMLETAVEAYEKMMEKSPAYYGAYPKLFNAYMKTGKYAEAAQVYEQLLSNPTINLNAYGVDIARVRMDLADVYIKLKEFDEAADHLRQVIVTPPDREDQREKALSQLISIFNEQGKIEKLIERYKGELAEKNRVLGESYLGIVRIYHDEGSIMKAKTYVQRLEQLGLTEYAEKARRLVEDQETESGG